MSSKKWEIITDTSSHIFFNQEQKVAIECSNISYRINDRFMRVSSPRNKYKSKFICKSNPKTESNNLSLKDQPPLDEYTFLEGFINDPSEEAKQYRARADQKFKKIEWMIKAYDGEEKSGSGRFQSSESSITAKNTQYKEMRVKPARKTLPSSEIEIHKKRIAEQPIRREEHYSDGYKEQKHVLYEYSEVPNIRTDTKATLCKFNQEQLDQFYNPTTAIDVRRKGIIEN